VQPEELSKRTPWPESASELYRPSDRQEGVGKLEKFILMIESRNRELSACSTVS
jgi:hypothetical protein